MGRLRTLAEYQQCYPGHEEGIAEEWRWLEPEGQPLTTEPGDAGHQEERRSIGPYRILSELGRGAQATVYLAEHESLRRQVALKVLHSSLLGTGTNAQKRFQREAEATANLDHPGICSVYETGYSDGLNWIAMQHVQGKTLAASLLEWHGRNKGSTTSSLALPMPTASTSTDAKEQSSSSGDSQGSRQELIRIVTFFEEAARALHLAHEHGLVHRDIKPGNLMVKEDGSPVVLDFGLAHQDASESLGLTGSTDVLGTPYYMAPEQLRDQPGTVDRRTDVYALGVTLYECVTGQRPFDAASREALYHKILHENPENARSHNHRIPSDLEVVILTAIDKDRGRRYQTALALAEDLQRVRKHEPIAAKPVSRLGRLSRWAKRHPAVATSSTVALISLIVGLLTSLMFLDRANESLSKERQALSREQQMQAGWYDDVSHAVAVADVYGRPTTLQGKLRKYALTIIDKQVPGFRRSIEGLTVTGWRPQKMGLRRFYGERLLSVLDQLDDVGALCASDLLHEWARRLLFECSIGDGEISYREISAEDWAAGIRDGDNICVKDLNAEGIELARRALPCLKGLEHDDIRLVRARILLLDGLLQSQTPEHLADARAKCSEWMSTIQPGGSHGEELLLKLYMSRQLAVLAAQGAADELETVRERIDDTLDSVVSAYPNTWFANGALAAKVEVHEELGVSNSTARFDLGTCLANSARWVDGYPVGGWRQAKASVGTDRKSLWEWMKDLEEQSLQLLQSEGASELLSQLDERLTELRIESGDPILHEIANRLATAGENQLRYGRAHGPVGHLYSTAIALHEKGPLTNLLTATSLAGPLSSHYMSRNRAADAEKTLRNAMDAMPSDSPTREWYAAPLGFVVAAQGNYENGEQLMLRGIRAVRKWQGEATGNEWQLVRKIITLYRQWGRPDEAVRWCKHLITTYGDLSIDHNHLAYVLMEMGRLEESAAAIETAERHGLPKEHGVNLRARLALARGDHVQAAALASSMELHGLSAQALLAAGEDAEALRHFERTNPTVDYVGQLTFPNYWSDYGLCLVRNGQEDRAREVLEELTQTMPSYAEAWHERARFLATAEFSDHATNDRAQAVECAERACEPNKRNRAFMLAMLAEAHSRAGDNKAAHDTALEVLEKMAGRDAQWLTNSDMQRRADRYEKAKNN